MQKNNNIQLVGYSIKKANFVPYFCPQNMATHRVFSKDPALKNVLKKEEFILLTDYLVRFLFLASIITTIVVYISNFL